METIILLSVYCFFLLSHNIVCIVKFPVQNVMIIKDLKSPESVASAFVLYSLAIPHTLKYLSQSRCMNEQKAN